MTNSAVATRYANALADVVTGPNSAIKPADAVTELRSFQATVAGSPELHNALITPAVPTARKRAVVGRIADMLQLSRISRNFLMILIDHRRIAALGAMVDAFEIVLDERLGFARAEVLSATELNDSDRQALSAELERLTGKKIRTRFGVDGSLIGGVVARIGSTVYDGSVRAQLQSIERRLSAES
jgi:F-type H+-transporting ATPase subunit delta